MQTICNSSETSQTHPLPGGYLRPQVLAFAILAGVAGLSLPFQRTIALRSAAELATVIVASLATLWVAALLSDWIHHIFLHQPRPGEELLRSLLPPEPGEPAPDAEALACRVAAAFTSLRQRHAEAEQTAETFAHLCGELEQQTYALDQHSIVAMTDLAGRISYANDLFCKISGYSRAELLGKDHRILKSGHHSREFFTEMYRTIRSGEIWHGELLNKAKSGRLYWVDTTIVPLLGDDGRVDRYVAIRTDITEKKKAADELRAAMESAKAAFHAKRDFLSTMSHELRTPLNGILGSANLLADTSLNEEQRDLVSTLKESGRSLLALVEDLMEMQELRNGSLTFESAPYRLDELLQSVAAASQPLAERKGLALRLIVPPSLPGPSPADPRRVRQVLAAMVNNAIKFSSQGTVTVEASAVEGLIKVRVLDEGIGVPVDKASLLFEEFSQVDSSASRRHGGAGLSLAISRQMIERMGGSIGYQPSPGGGSEFWFTLPAAVQTLATSRTTAAALPEGRTGVAAHGDAPAATGPRRP